MAEPFLSSASLPPVVIHCFDRVDYAQQLADSLAMVEGIATRSVLAFQDGAVHRGNGSDKASVLALDRVRDIVLGRLPHASFQRFEWNLGIGDAIQSAQYKVFVEDGWEYAYFVEDDVVLAPTWLTVMDSLREAATRVGLRGFVSGYGPYGAPIEWQALNIKRTELAVRHLRAYGQSRVHALEISAFLLPFYEAIGNLDYSDAERRATALIDRLGGWFESVGSRPLGSSQDGFRDWASRLLGYSDLHTLGSWVKYIGEWGVHESPESFEAAGYAETKLLDEAPDGYEIPCLADALRWNHEQLRLYEDSLERYRNRNLSSASDLPQPVKPSNAAEWRGNLPLTLPDREAKFLTAQLRNCSAFLEYGSGGSTILAGRCNVPSIVTIETDREFLDSVMVALGPSRSRTVGVYVDIGPTIEWGYPADDSGIRTWHRYALEGWKSAAEFGIEPDLVLIDGRFRVVSFLVSLLRAPIGANILFNDFVDRPHYRVVESVVTPQAVVGRMAMFHKDDHTNEDLLGNSVHDLILEYSIDSK